MKIYPSNMNHLRYTKPTAQEIQEQYYFPCSITVLNLTTKIAEVFYYDGDGAECALGKTEIPSDYLIKKSLSKTDAAPTVIGLYPLEETGTYANLGNINAEAGKLNFASFDGSAWGLVGVEIPNSKVISLDFPLNGYISGDGTFVLLNGFISTDFQEIFSNNFYLTSHNGTMGAESGVALAFYDERKIFISGNVGDINYSNTEIIVPDNAKYFRMCAPSGRSCTVKYNLTDSYFLSRNEKELLENYGLFDVTSQLTFKLGYLQNSDIGANDNWSTSNWFEINPKSNYFFTTTSIDGAPVSMSFLDESGMFISSIGEQILNFEKVTIPANAKYMAVCQVTSRLNKFKIYTDNLIKEYSNNDDNFVVPAKIDAVVGRECSIFTNGMFIQKNNFKKLITRFEGSVPNSMSIRNEHFLFTPNSNDSDFLLLLYNHDKNFKWTKRPVSTLRIIPKNQSGTYNVLVIGDSLIADGQSVNELKNLFTEDADVTVNFIGTKISGSIRHEGRSGWSYSSYVNNKTFNGETNPFLYLNGSGGYYLDFKKYFNDNKASHFPSASTIDYVIIALGTNDAQQGNSVITETDVDNIVNNCKTFINALKDGTTGFPNAKIAIGLSAIGAPNGQSGNMEWFKYNILRINQRLIKTFDNGVYNSKITTVNQGNRTDVVNSYPHSDVPICSRTTVTERIYTDSIHPLLIGYETNADGFYAKLRAFIFGIL